MTKSNSIWARCLLAGLLMAALPGFAQSPPVQIYTLLSGSELSDECLLCGLPPIIVPLAGNFGLQMLDQTPLSTRYALVNISFTSAATSGPQYQVTGSGVYEVGGEVAVKQQMFLNTQISDGTTMVNALCSSSTDTVVQPWPRIQIKLAQTNGTSAKLFGLTLVAVPAPQIRGIVPDRPTGDVLLEWDQNGASNQLERASSVLGPYVAVTPATTNLSFNDPGVLTNSAQFFYRLRPF